MKYIVFPLFGAILIILFYGHTLPKYSKADIPLLQKAELASKNIPAKLALNSMQSGVVNLADGEQITERELQRRIIKKVKYRKFSDATLTLYDKQIKPAIVSAMGLDWQHHFANSYLVGVRPFPVKNDWLPLYVISLKKTYEYDIKRYHAHDIWQNSAQAYQLNVGDCEDHAILLADWLISEGLDARVVLGSVNGSGHAWVVVKRAQQFFLLEATSKRAGKSWEYYPLAKYITEYQPMMMFNRTEFWVNKSRTNKNNYHEDMWIKTAHFKRDSH